MSDQIAPLPDPLRDPAGGPDESPAPVETHNHLKQFWDWVLHAGLAEPALRVATFGASILLVFAVIGGLRTLFFAETETGTANGPSFAFSVPQPTPTPTAAPPVLPLYQPVAAAPVTAIQREIDPYTIVPSRPRVSVITYTVQTGDSVFGIAEQFGLKPETVLWGNYAVLADNPHRLQPAQVLQIMPTDGTLHRWTAGENLQKVAEFYRVAASEIIEWPGNPFDVYDTDVNNPGISPGTLLIVPGGQREMIDYGPPRIPREDPAVARTFGPGHCGTLMDGALGDGSFIWPTVEQWLTGYDYSPGTNHWGIDIAGDQGNQVWSIDHGVVVYSGWSNNGYGNLVVVDHGNGWQSLYAHLNEIYVGCGESVFQGTTLGTVGNTGNSGGAHLHFELIYGTAKVNPWDFLP